MSRSNDMPKSGSDEFGEPDRDRLDGYIIMDRYNLVRVLGHGSFGAVYLGVDMHSNTNVALKINARIEFRVCGIPHDVIREISFLKKLNRQDPPANVVRLLDSGIHCIYGQHCVVLVMELMQGTLLEVVPPQIRLHAFVVQNLMRQLLEGVYDLHKRGIIHRDLKPQNILLRLEENGDLSLKIGDLGMGRAIRKPIKYTKYQICTLKYRAPEIMLGSDDYGPPVDVWSIATIFAEMATCESLSEPLFPARTDLELIPIIVREIGLPKPETIDKFKKVASFRDFYFPTNPTKVGKMSELLEDLGENGVMTDLGLDLFEKMCQWDPEDRISVKEALEHDYFKQNFEF